MLTPTVFETKFETHQPLKFTAGQFISIIIPGAGPKGRDLRRAYSIASPPEFNPLELCIKLVEGGPGTEYLYRLRDGDTFKAMASYGDFVFEPKPGRNACFISTGTGIAPFRSMVLSEHFKNNLPPQTHCLLGVRTEDELLYEETFGNIPNLKFVQAVSQPTEKWKGYSGRVTQYLSDLGDDFPWLETEFYLCGNGSMINEVKALLNSKSVAKDSVHQEIYYR
jgi:ferredoxin-NADP reductase